jgi:hypothetical protein
MRSLRIVTLTFTAVFRPRAESVLVSPVPGIVAVAENILSITPESAVWIGIIIVSKRIVVSNRPNDYDPTMNTTLSLSRPV